MSINAVFGELRKHQPTKINEEEQNTNLNNAGEENEDINEETLDEGAMSDKDLELREKHDPDSLESEDRKDLLPKEDHVYWDDKHENAVIVVAVYPDDDKVTYWNQDGDRFETDITDFLDRYEPSTNEDDYDLFYDDEKNNWQ